MIKYPMNGSLVHISKDGERTRCGRDCTDWWTEEVSIDWAGQKSDCPRCGTSADFRVVRDERDAANREREALVAAIVEQRSAIYQQRLAALEVLSSEWATLMNERYPDEPFVVERRHGVTTITGAVAQDKFTFDVTVRLAA